jgi:prepilin-type N-terminal cleavage/methylation domain-containing protein
MNPYARSRIRAPEAFRSLGMTLIEVLVVVGIIALLLAILLPALAAARQQARRLGCASGLRATGQALNVYKADTGRYPCPGDRDPAKVFGASWRAGNSRMYRPTTKLAEIGDIAEALVARSLGDPRAMYCPTSLDTDPHGPRPYLRRNVGGRPVPIWKTGQISYMYLVGLDYDRPESTFLDPAGQPTFNPATEAPEQRVNHVNPRTVLIGDRTVEIVPPNRNIAGSNHGYEGGWFLFTSGDAQWWSWPRLTAHPTSIYIWYWPRTSCIR